MRRFRSLTWLLAAGLGLPACADDTTKTTADAAASPQDTASLGDSSGGSDTSANDGAVGDGTATTSDTATSTTDVTQGPSDTTGTTADAGTDTTGSPDASGDATFDATVWPVMPAPQVLAVVGSDFKTSAVSLVDFPAGKATASGFLTSGTQIGAGGTGLSGDVVLGQTPGFGGQIALVDRGNSVITLVDPANKAVVGQISVGTGFAANPQDYAPVSETRAFVARMAKNPKPTAAPGDFDEGDDLLIVDPQAKKITGRVDLSTLATLAGTNAAPQRMAFDGKRVWVPLGSISADFSKQGPGRVVAVDAQTGAISATIDLPDLQNCLTARYVVATHTVVVVCSGSFGAADPLKVSGIVTLDAKVEKPIAKLAVSAAATGAAFGKDLALASTGEGGLAVTVGNFDKKTNDVIWFVDLATGKVSKVGEAGGAFSVNGAFGWGSKVWIGEAFHSGGDLRVFDLAGGKAVELPPVASNPGGFGAADLGGF